MGIIACGTVKNKGKVWGHLVPEIQEFNWKLLKQLIFTLHFFHLAEARC
jgi:hypothetical protein